MFSIPAALLTLAPACPAYFQEEMTTTAGYQYFYPCSSGIIDCSFAPQEYADYGLPNDISARQNATDMKPGATASNAIREAAGGMAGNELAAEFTDINNNGLIEGINWADGPVIAKFGQRSYDLLRHHNGKGTRVRTSIASNDQNTIPTDAGPIILTDAGPIIPTDGGPIIVNFNQTSGFDVNGQPVEDVRTLAPAPEPIAPVPEPTSVVLLAVAAGLVLYGARIRKRQGIERSGSGAMNAAR